MTLTKWLQLDSRYDLAGKKRHFGFRVMRKGTNIKELVAISSGTKANAKIGPKLK